MPLRGLIYFGRLYAKHVRRHGLNMHGRRLIELPTPRCRVFYVGVEDAPDAQVLRLSDSFGGQTGDVGVTATAININEGRNGRILGACETLAGIPEEDIVAEVGPEGLSPIVGPSLSHTDDAKSLLEEWDEEAYREAMRKEAREDGFEEGRKEGRKDIVAHMVEQIRAGRLTVADASALTGVPEEEIAAEL